MPCFAASDWSFGFLSLPEYGYGAMPSAFSPRCSSLRRCHYARRLTLLITPPPFRAKRHEMPFCRREPYCRYACPLIEALSACYDMKSVLQPPPTSRQLSFFTRCLVDFTPVWLPPPEYVFAAAHTFSLSSRASQPAILRHTSRMPERCYFAARYVAAQSASMSPRESPSG